MTMMMMMMMMNDNDDMYAYDMYLECAVPDSVVTTIMTYTMTSLRADVIVPKRSFIQPDASARQTRNARLR